MNRSVVETLLIIFRSMVPPSCDWTSQSSLGSAFDRSHRDGDHYDDPHGENYQNNSVFLIVLACSLLALTENSYPIVLAIFGIYDLEIGGSMSRRRGKSLCPIIITYTHKLIIKQCC